MRARGLVWFGLVEGPFTEPVASLHRSRRLLGSKKYLLRILGFAKRLELSDESLLHITQYDDKVGRNQDLRHPTPRYPGSWNFCTKRSSATGIFHIMDMPERRHLCATLDHIPALMMKCRRGSSRSPTIIESPLCKAYGERMEGFCKLCRQHVEL
jgi:hypothetical protein